MSNQIVISSGAKVRELEGVLTGTSGIVSSVPLGAANGVATLDSGGKVPVSQLPSSVVTYLGTWNAATNTPTLTNGVGDAGDMYICNVAGTVNFGAGPITFAVGDWVLYGSGTWQKSNGQNGTVTSVAASITGNSVGITGSPISTAGTLAFAFAGTNLQYVNGAGNLTTFPTLITSIGLSMPSAFSVANSPLTANGTIAVTGAGVASQYIRGDGTLASFPTGGGGGSSVSYYLNGGTNQGTFVGNTYYEMSKNAVIGTGVDFTINANGYISQFITDANDPAQLVIPAGNWNFEMYFSASSGGGSPSFYVELYKYNGSTFTLIADNSANPEYITNGTAIDLYTTAVAVPETSLTITDRLAIRVYVLHASKTITLHTQNSHLCEVITTFSTGITALNGLTAQVQYFQTGTSGTDFNISSTTATHTFNIPDASATARGLITTGTQTIAGIKTFTSGINVDYIGVTGDIGMDGSFSLKQVAYGTLQSGYTNLSGQTNGLRVGLFGGYNALLNFSTSGSYTYTFPAATGTIALVGGSGVGTVTSVAALTIGTSGTDLSSTVATSTTTPVITLNVPTASATNRGALSSADWSTFNGKESVLTFSSPLVRTTNTISIPAATSSVNGYLSATDWNIFNGKIGGGGTTNYIPKFSGTFSIADSIIYDNSGKVLINTTDSSIGHRLAVYSATEAAQLRVMGLAPSVLFTESTTNTNTYSAYLGVVTSTNNFYTGSFVGDFVMSNNSNYGIAFAVNNSQKLRIANTGAATFASSVTATSFVKTSGTSSQFLKADGSVDSSTYYLASNPSAFIALTALSFVAGSGAYNSTTGVITIPTNNNQITNGAGYITSSALSAYLPLTGGTLTGALGGTSASFSSSVTAVNAILNNSANNNTNALSISGASSTAKAHIGQFSNGTYLSSNWYYDSAQLNDDISLGAAAINMQSSATSNASQINFSLKDAGSGGVSSKMTILSGGNVGIGTSSPASPLTINATAGAAQFNITRSEQTNQGFSIQAGGGETTFNSYEGTNSVNGAYVFNSTKGSTTTERMRINSAGSLLVGTTDDGGRLVSYSTTAATQIKAAGTAPAITFSNTITSPTIGGSLGACTSANQFITGTAAGDMVFVNQFTGSLILGTNSAARLTISNAGSATFSSSVQLGNSSGGTMLTVGTSGAASFGSPTAIQMDNSYQSTVGNTTGLKFYLYKNGTETYGFGLNSSAGVEYHTGGYHGFYTATSGTATERMRITSGGNVGIGTSSPTTAKLHMLYSSSTDAGLYAESSSTNYTGTLIQSLTYTAAGTGWNHFVGYSNIGGTVNVKIIGNGNIQNANNSYGAISDIKLKENIIDASPKLNDLLKVKIRNYNLIGSETKQIGVIAQEIEQIFPAMIEETIDIDKDGNDLGTTTKSVKYSVFVPMLVKAIQEQQKQIEELKLKIK